MAFVALVPSTMNIQARIGAAQEFKSSAVLDFAGAAVNLSAFTALTAKLVPTSAGPTSADVTIGTVTADANGIVTLILAAADLSALSPGTANLVITGKPTGPDDAQLLCSGTCTVQAG